jgi:hypothetical protein
LLAVAPSQTCRNSARVEAGSQGLSEWEGVQLQAFWHCPNPFCPPHSHVVPDMAYWYLTLDLRVPKEKPPAKVVDATPAACRSPMGAEARETERSPWKNVSPSYLGNMGRELGRVSKKSCPPHGLWRIDGGRHTDQRHQEVGAHLHRPQPAPREGRFEFARLTSRLGPARNPPHGCTKARCVAAANRL